AAGGDLAQGPRRLARVRADEELAAFRTLRIGFPGVARLELDFETSALHAELAQQRRDCRAQQSRGSGSARAEPLRGRLPRRRMPRLLLLEAGDARAGVAQAVQFLAQAFRMWLEVGHPHAMLAREFVQFAEACLGLRERPRVEDALVLVAGERAA